MSDFAPIGYGFILFVVVVSLYQCTSETVKEPFSGVTSFSSGADFARLAFSTKSPDKALEISQNSKIIIDSVDKCMREPIPGWSSSRAEKCEPLLRPLCFFRSNFFLFLDIFYF